MEIEINKSMYIIYDTLRDKFTKPIKYEMISSSWRQFDPAEFISCVYDIGDQLLDIYSEDTGRLGVMDMNTNKVNIISDAITIDAVDSIFMVNDNLHIEHDIMEIITF